MNRLPLTVLSVFCAPITQGFADEIVIRDVRPVAAAVERLEELFHFPVTYEDSPYLFAGDVEDITAKVARPEALAIALAGGESLPVLKGMKERELRFRFAPAVTPENQLAAIRAALQANNNSEYPPAMFDVRQMGGRFHVYPTKIKNSAGEYVTYQSLLGVRVTLEPKERDCFEFYEEFYRSVSRATEVGMEGAFVTQRTCRTAVGGSNVVARELLLEHLAELERSPAASGKISWQLLCDAMSPNVFALNMHVVPSDSPMALDPNLTTSNSGPTRQRSPASNKNRTKSQSRSSAPVMMRFLE